MFLTILLLLLIFVFIFYLIFVFIFILIFINSFFLGEFVVMLLAMMGKLSEEEIQLAATIFDKLDYNGDGKIIYTYM